MKEHLKNDHLANFDAVQSNWKLWILETLYGLEGHTFRNRNICMGFFKDFNACELANSRPNMLELAETTYFEIPFHESI